MSRLEQHEKKQWNQRLLIAIVLIGAAIVFFFSMGIKLLVSLTLFVNQMANGNTKQQQVQEKQTFNTVNIDPIPSATNSSTLAFSGTALNFDLLELYLNDEKQDEIAITDTFTGEIKGLEKGDNTVYFIAKSSQSKDTQKTQEYSVLYKSDKPKLEITSPADNFRTNKEDVVISGTTEKETTIRVNDLPVVVDADGKFSAPVRLKDGENKIVIIADDIVGNQEQKTLTITYAKDD